MASSGGDLLNEFGLRAKSTVTLEFSAHGLRGRAVMHGKVKPTAAESAHMARIKSMPCICCKLLGVAQAHATDVHHIIVNDQPRNHWLTLPLCWSCHQGPKGAHGDKSFLRILKVTEWTLLGCVIASFSMERG